MKMNLSLLPYFLLISAKMDWYYHNGTFPINADEPPRRAIPTATLAGAPPGAFLNAGASANESPLMVGQSKPQERNLSFLETHHLLMLYLVCIRKEAHLKGQESHYKLMKSWKKEEKRSSYI